MPTLVVVQEEQNIGCLLLFNAIFAIVAMVLDNVSGISFEPGSVGPIYAIYGLAMFIPGLAVAVRRLHDTGKSGWMLLIALIPLVGAIWLIVLMATNGTPGNNQFGQNPKEIA